MGESSDLKVSFMPSPSTSTKPAYSYLPVTFSRLDPDPPTSPLNGADAGRWLDALDDDEFADLPDLADVSDDEDDEERDDEEMEDDDEQDEDDNNDDEDDDNDNDEDDDNDDDEDDEDNDDDNDSDSDEDDERDDGDAGGGDMDPVDRDLLRDAAPAGPGRHSVPPEVNAQVLQGGLRRVFHSVLSGKFSCYSLPSASY